MADRAPARGFANAYAAAKVVTMNLLDLTPRQLKRAAAIKKRITDLKTAKQIGLMIPPAVLARADRIIK
jgi:hypothetical protein